MDKGDKKYDFYCEEALTGKTPLHIVYESEKVLSFHHTRPSYQFHVIIIPKEHIKDLLALENGRHNELILEVMEVAQKIIAENMSTGLQGFRLITNVGSFQETPHLHFHVIAGEKTTKPSGL
jgi:histidine triad (HIT) family protein